MPITPVKRALLSVSDKTNIVYFARALIELGVDIISTGGTSKALLAEGIKHRQVDDITLLPEMLGGRVKTLHPKIHGGILAKRDEHAAEMAEHGIDQIDLVVVNFYPFAKNVQPDTDWKEAVEYIDIGGPTMVRAAAKNFAWVGVITDPNDYDQVLGMLRDQGGLDDDMRRQLAAKVFALTSAYDGMIQQYFMQKGMNQKNPCPEQFNLQFKKNMELRYGENPHQKACAYQFEQGEGGILAAHQHQGKPLSYNNILDSEAAWTCVSEFSMPTCVIIKHANPCGVASAANIEDAYTRAYQADASSAFGGIVALNRPCTKAIAQAISAIFMEVVIAPAYTPEALDVLSSKVNLRVLEMPKPHGVPWEYKFIQGGVLMQEKDQHVLLAEDLKVVTRTKLQKEDADTMLFAWQVLKHIKSNGILIAKQFATLGIGAGQVSRIDSVDIAVRKAGEQIKNSILASDAFFPFRDSIDRIAKSGIRAIIQPGVQCEMKK